MQTHSAPQPHASSKQQDVLNGIYTTLLIYANKSCSQEGWVGINHAYDVIKNMTDSNDAVFNKIQIKMLLLLDKYKNFNPKKKKNIFAKIQFILDKLQASSVTKKKQISEDDPGRMAKVLAIVMKIVNDEKSDIVSEQGITEIYDILKQATNGKLNIPLKPETLKKYSIDESENYKKLKYQLIIQCRLFLKHALQDKEIDIYLFFAEICQTVEAAYINVIIDAQLSSNEVLDVLNSIINNLRLYQVAFLESRKIETNYITKLADQGNVDAQVHRGISLLKIADTTNDTAHYENALRYLAKAADAKNSRALTMYTVELLTQAEKYFQPIRENESRSQTLLACKQYVIDFQNSPNTPFYPVNEKAIQHTNSLLKKIDYLLLLEPLLELCNSEPTLANFQKLTAMQEQLASQEDVIRIRVALLYYKFREADPQNLNKFYDIINSFNNKSIHHYAAKALLACVMMSENNYAPSMILLEDIINKKSSGSLSLSVPEANLEQVKAFDKQQAVSFIYHAMRSPHVNFYRIMCEILSSRAFFCRKKEKNSFINVVADLEAEEKTVRFVNYLNPDDRASQYDLSKLKVALPTLHQIQAQANSKSQSQLQTQTQTQAQIQAAPEPSEEKDNEKYANLIREAKATLKSNHANSISKLLQAINLFPNYIEAYYLRIMAWLLNKASKVNFEKLIIRDRLKLIELIPSYAILHKKLVQSETEDPQQSSEQMQADLRYNQAVFDDHVRKVQNCLNDENYPHPRRQEINFANYIENEFDHLFVADELRSKNADEGLIQYHYRRALEEAPYDVVACLTYAGYLSDKEQFAESHKVLNDFLLQHNYPPVRIFLAESLALSGERDKAHQELCKLIRSEHKLASECVHDILRLFVKVRILNSDNEHMIALTNDLKNDYTKTENYCWRAIYFMQEGKLTEAQDEVYLMGLAWAITPGEKKSIATRMLIKLVIQESSVVLKRPSDERAENEVNKTQPPVVAMIPEEKMTVALQAAEKNHQAQLEKLQVAHAAEMKRLTEDNQKFRDKHKAVAAQLNSVNMIAERDAASHRDLVKKFEQLSNENKNLKKKSKPEINTSNSSSSELENRLASKDQEIQELRNALSIYDDKEKDKAKIYQQRLDQQVTLTDDLTHKLRTERLNFDSAKQELEDKNKCLALEIEKLKHQLLEAEKARLEMQTKSLTDENNYLREKMQLLDRVAANESSLRAENEKLLSALTKISSEKAKEDADSVNVKLQNTLTKFTSESERLLGELTKVSSATEKLQGSLANANSENTFDTKRIRTFLSDVKKESGSWKANAEIFNAFSYIVGSSTADDLLKAIIKLAEDQQKCVTYVVEPGFRKTVTDNLAFFTTLNVDDINTFVAKICSFNPVISVSLLIQLGILNVCFANCAQGVTRYFEWINGKFHEALKANQPVTLTDVYLLFLVTGAADLVIQAQQAQYLVAYLQSYINDNPYFVRVFGGNTEWQAKAVQYFGEFCNYLQRIAMPVAAAPGTYVPVPTM